MSQPLRTAQACFIKVCYHLETTLYITLKVLKKIYLAQVNVLNYDHAPNIEPIRQQRAYASTTVFLVLPLEAAKIRDSSNSTLCGFNWLELVRCSGKQSTHIVYLSKSTNTTRYKINSITSKSPSFILKKYSIQYQKKVKVSKVKVLFLQ